MTQGQLIHACLGTQLRRNAVAGAASSVANVLIAAISYPIYLKYLGYELYGVWLALAIVLNVAQFGNLGLSPAVTKKVAEYYAHRDFDALRSSVTTALVALTLVGIVFAALIVAFGHKQVEFLRLTPALSRQAIAMLPSIAILSVYMLQIDTLNGVLNGLGRLDLAVAIQVASRSLTLAVSASLMACSYGVQSLPIGFLVGNTFMHAASHYWIWRVSGTTCFRLRTFDPARLKQLLAFGGGVAGCSLMNMLVSPFNKFMLARYAGPGSIPVYELSYTVGMQLKGVFDTALRSMMPEISRLSSLGSPEHLDRVKRIYARALRLILGIGAPLFLGALLFAPVALKLWLGPRFHADITPAARILIAGAFFSLSAAPGYYLLVGIGRLRPLLFGNMLQSLTNMVPLLLLVGLGWSFSPQIAAASTAAGMVCGATYILFAARRVQLCR